MKTENKMWIALLVLLTAHLLTIVDIFIVNIAIPSIQKGLKTTNADTQLVVAMYMIGFASFLIIGGRAGDYYGRKKLFIIGLSFFMIFSASCGFATSPEQLILFRFLQGISAGLMSPQVLSYIQILFLGHKERTYALGCYGIAIGIGTMLGQFLGGFLVEVKPVFVDQSWRYIFLINIPICIINIFLAVLFLKNSADTSVQHMDYKSTFILCTVLILMLFSITIGLEYSLIIPFITLSFSILLWIYFIKRQKKKSQENSALLNLALFQYKNFNLAIAAAAFFMFMLDAYFFVLAIFLQEGMHLLPVEAGQFIIFQGSGFIITSLFAPRLILRFGKNILIFGTCLIITALILQLILFNHSTIDWKSYLIMVIHGTGVALVLPSFANIALKGLPENIIGNASGVYSTIQQFAGALGIAVTGGLFYYNINKDYDFLDFYNSLVYTALIHFFCLICIILLLIQLPKSILSVNNRP